MEVRNYDNYSQYSTYSATLTLSPPGLSPSPPRLKLLT